MFLWCNSTGSGSEHRQLINNGKCPISGFEPYFSFCYVTWLNLTPRCEPLKDGGDVCKSHSTEKGSKICSADRVKFDSLCDAMLKPRPSPVVEGIGNIADCNAWHENSAPTFTL